MTTQVIDHATGEIIDMMIDNAVAKMGIPNRTARAGELIPPVPQEFVGPDGDPCEYLYREELDARMHDLVGRYTELFHVHGLNVLVLWKAAGGKTGGKRVLGKCQKLSGIARYLSARDTSEPVDCIIWLAADHCSSRDAHGIEAVLYHELCHIGMDFKTGKPLVRSHEFAGFLNELKRYEQHTVDLRELDKVIRQLPLLGGDE